MYEIVISRRLLRWGLIFMVVMVGLLVLAWQRPNLPSWAGGAGPDAVAQAVAEAALTVDYRDQSTWKAGLYPWCAPAGVEFWETNLRQGLWLHVEQRAWITEQVHIADVSILDQCELGGAGAAVVRVRGQVMARTVARQEPFTQVQLLAREPGTTDWRFVALLTQGDTALTAAAPAAQQLVLAPSEAPTGTARAWLNQDGQRAALPTTFVSTTSARSTSPTWLIWPVDNDIAVAVPAAWPPGRGHAWQGWTL
ncbi:MAG: hypothetical protein KKB13_27105 [Chloroflexi bacterium]|nr:hypothetical protein [Chloroflexota bacterium]